LTAQSLSTSCIAGAPKLLAPIIGQLLASNRHATADVRSSRFENGGEIDCFAEWRWLACRSRHNAHDQQLVNLPVLSPIIYANPWLGEALGSDRFLQKP